VCDVNEKAAGISLPPFYLLCGQIYTRLGKNAEATDPFTSGPAALAACCADCSQDFTVVRFNDNNGGAINPTSTVRGGEMPSFSVFSIRQLYSPSEYT
jgi:hypothetical protein